MPTATAGAPRALRAATVRLRGVAAPPPPMTTNKRARPPTADSSTLASSPLPHRPTNDVTVVTEDRQPSPTKRSRTAVATPLVPSTPPSRDTAPATPPTPNKTATTRVILPTIPPVITNVPEDVARISGIPDGYVDALAAALSIVYEADDHVGAAVDTIL